MAEQYTTIDQTKEGLTRLKGYTDTDLAKKQNTLVSGTNIKTINNQSILGSGNLTIEGGVTVDDALSDTSRNPVQNRVLYGSFDSMRQVVETMQTDVAGNTTAIAGKQDSPEYELSIVGSGGNVERIGSITIDGTKYGLFQFFYKTGALPNTNTREYNLSVLLTEYTVKDFIDATGITSNGIFVGNGRTDGTNRVIVQQFSKNNKTVTIRTYQDFSTNTATLKIQFIGTKYI